MADFTPERAPVIPTAPPSAKTPRPKELAPGLASIRTDALPLPSALLEDSNHGLDAFYQALWRTESREHGAVTRIVHYGDSPTTADLITGDVRAILQKRFGDAGHGFIRPDDRCRIYTAVAEFFTMHR